MTLQPDTRRRQLLLGLAACAAAPVRAQPAGEPLSIVLSPFLSPAGLLATYRPLREHLQRALQRPVELLTAKDFRTLAEEARRGEHRVVQLPAHLARLAMLDWGWQLLAAPTVTVNVVVATKAGGPVTSAADLRGRSVGMLDALSLTAGVGRRWLELQGVAADVNVMTLASVNSAMYALERDEIAALVAADTQLAALPTATPRNERVLARIGDIPGPLFLAAPAMPAAERQTLRAAMERFVPDATQPPTAANSRLAPLDEARLKTLDGYAAAARQALGGPVR